MYAPADPFMERPDNSIAPTAVSDSHFVDSQSEFPILTVIENFWPNPGEFKHMVFD
jgi:hypothetical protein